MSKEIYNIIYTKNEQYNQPMIDKYNFIDTFINKHPESILDVGCGKGHNLKRLFKCGFNIHGVEISDVCCNKYLLDLPHTNTNFLEFAKLNNFKYDSLICFDVLEHIVYSDIDQFISSCKQMSNNCLFGVANHSDIQHGIELHPIQEEVEWWEIKLNFYFSQVITVYKRNDFFIFECSV